MAIGLGRMFGFEFMENFRYPYTAKSITEFWRRWHISLSTWFREYLYIPLGGNRCGKGRWLVNMLIVWAATGIWHGACWNYLLWGLYFFVLLVIEKLVLGNWLSKLPDVLRHLYVMSLVLISWAIFALEDPMQLGAYLRAMVGLNGAPLLNSQTLYYLRSFLPVLIYAGVSSTPLIANLWNRINNKTIQLLILILGMILCTAYVVASTYNPFLYFRF
jgi:alginate O-acetyltransferase complex protein AlgI